MKSRSPKRLVYLRKEFGTQLQRLRQSARRTQKQLAVLSGLSQGGISKWEGGEREPVWSEVVALARALNVTPDDFLTPVEVKNAEGNAEIFQNRAVSPAQRFGDRLYELRNQRSRAMMDLQEIYYESRLIGGQDRMRAGLSKLSVTMIANWESGKHEPRWSAVVALAMVLSRVPVGYGLNAKKVVVTPNDFL